MCTQKKEILDKCLQCLIEESAKSTPLENLLFLPRHIGILRSHTRDERLPDSFTQWQSKHGGPQSLANASGEVVEVEVEVCLLHGIHHSSMRRICD